MERKNIEIPFGAFDSELGGFEYTIPEGYEAEIKEGKVIVKKKESEDERIIERIKKAVESYWSDEPLDEILAYLEKQGEQKPVDNVEPKFKVGDWVVTSQGKVSQVVSVDADVDGFTLDDDTYFSGSWKDNYHLWTIQDAKDGDVLLFEGSYNSIVLFQGIGINGKGRINYHCKCDLGNYSFGIQGDVACLGTIEEDAKHYHPATKEQRDLLFSKMKEAGYEWDAEKKELKEIEQKSSTSVTEFDTEVEKFCKESFITDTNEKGNVFCIARHFADWQKNRQMLSWSEKDDAIYDGIIETELYMLDVVNGIKKFDVGNTSIKEECTRELNWLKSLKEKVQPQFTWRPSEHELEVLKLVAEKDGTCLMGLYKQLKKLKEE